MYTYIYIYVYTYTQCLDVNTYYVYSSLYVLLYYMVQHLADFGDEGDGAVQLPLCVLRCVINCVITVSVFIYAK